MYPYKSVTAQTKLNKKKLYLKKIYKKKNFFFKNQYINKISFWDIAIYSKNTYLHTKCKFKNESLLHNRDVLINALFEQQNMILILKTNSKISLDISYAGIDTLNKIFFWKKFLYQCKYLRNHTCIYSTAYMELKSRSHLLLDNMHYNFSIESFKKQRWLRTCFKVTFLVYTTIYSSIAATEINSDGLLL